MLFQRHSGHLWAVSLRICGDAADASDALQDGILRAMRASGGYQGRAAVSTWLHRIVANCAIDLVRRRHPQLSLDDLTDGPGQAVLRAPGSDWDMPMDIEAALAALPVGQRLAVYLVDYEGWSIAEAASALGVAPGTVKSRCSRARAVLAPLLGDYRAAAAGNQSPPASVQTKDEQAAVNSGTDPRTARSEDAAGNGPGALEGRR